MAKLPDVNPIDAGYLNRGGAVDHLGTATIFCEACGTDRTAERYRMILGHSFGFGAHAFAKPFLKRSSTKGKVGKKGTYSLCCECRSLWSEDEGARTALEKLGADPEGIVPEHMHYEVLNRAIEEAEKPKPVGLASESKVRKLTDDTPPPQQEPQEKPIQPAPAPSASRAKKLEPEPAPQPANPVVDEDPEVRALREQLAAAEQAAEERLAAAEQAVEERRKEEELDRQKADKAQRVEELTRELAEAEAKLEELKHQGDGS